MIYTKHKHALQLCGFPFLNKITLSAILWSKKLDSTKWYAMLVHDV